MVYDGLYLYDPVVTRTTVVSVPCSTQSELPVGTSKPDVNLYPFLQAVEAL